MASYQFFSESTTRFAFGTYSLRQAAYDILMDENTIQINAFGRISSLLMLSLSGIFDLVHSIFAPLFQAQTNVIMYPTTTREDFIEAASPLALRLGSNHSHLDIKGELGIGPLLTSMTRQTLCVGTWC